MNVKKLKCFQSVQSKVFGLFFCNKVGLVIVRYIAFYYFISFIETLYAYRLYYSTYQFV